jgi:hypothetical protein
MAVAACAKIRRLAPLYATCGIIDAMIETMASTVEAAFQVFAEAEERASAARSRFPLAD